MLLAADPKLFRIAAPVSETRAAVEKLIPYIEQAMARGIRLHDVTRHLLGLFRGQPGARAFRRHLATKAVQQGAGVHVLREALAMVLDTNTELARTAAA
jgi:tRNA-dihydrouridine synthase A